MSTRILDGKGTGNYAEVDDHGRLYVKSNIVSHMSHHTTFHKNAYVKSFETTLADTSETPCALLYNNSSSSDLEIYWVRISANAAVEVDIYTDSSYTSDGTSISSINTNIGTANALSVIQYEGGSSADLVVNTSSEQLADGFFLAANDLIDMSYEGGIVLPFKKGVVIKVTGAATNKVKITMGFAVHSAGYKL